MKVRVIKNESLIANVGDIIEFTSPSENRDGTGFYLICQNNVDTNYKSQFFLICLDGTKGGEIKYYNSLKALLKYHEGKYKLHSSTLMELSLIEKSDD